MAFLRPDPDLGESVYSILFKTVFFLSLSIFISYRFASLIDLVIIVCSYFVLGKAFPPKERTDELSNKSSYLWGWTRINFYIIVGVIYLCVFFYLITLDVVESPEAYFRFEEENKSVSLHYIKDGFDMYSHSYFRDVYWLDGFIALKVHNSLSCSSDSLTSSDIMLSYIRELLELNKSSLVGVGSSEARDELMEMICSQEEDEPEVDCFFLVDKLFVYTVDSSGLVHECDDAFLVGEEGGLLIEPFDYFKVFGRCQPLDYGEEYFLVVDVEGVFYLNDSVNDSWSDGFSIIVEGRKPEWRPFREVKKEFMFVFVSGVDFPPELRAEFYNRRMIFWGVLFFMLIMFPLGRLAKKMKSKS